MDDHLHDLWTHRLPYYAIIRRDLHQQPHDHELQLPYQCGPGVRNAGAGPDAYPAHVEPLPELPDLPQNATLLDYLRSQASPPSGPGDYTLGTWQLHTHPDLLGRLLELAPGWPLTAAYGVPLLASDGIAAVAAFGTDFLAIRIRNLPPGIDTENPAPEWAFTRDDWRIISPWQSHLPSAESTRTLRELVSAALAHSASLAPK